MKQQHKVLVLGAGKIGSLIAFLLAKSRQYAVILADAQTSNPHVQKLGQFDHCEYITLDVKDEQALAELIKFHQISAVVSALPYFCNFAIATLAAALNVHYFDLTEDVKTTQAVKQLAANSHCAFVPQCGLAPGFISIVAHHLMQHFPQLDTVKMRVGALPLNISNALQYSLTWSTDGLINEYGNPCEAIAAGKLITLHPLEGLEEIKIDGLTYEAFNTSGGIGSLVQTYQNKVKDLNYKTIRHPGHCAKIKFLMNDLKLNHHRDLLKFILEQAIPRTAQDVVLVYVSVTGMQDNQLTEENYVKKFYPKMIDDQVFSAIQLTTASGICTALDLVINHLHQYRGFIRQEDFLLEDVLHNQFGHYFAEQADKEHANDYINH